MFWKIKKIAAYLQNHLPYSTLARRTGPRHTEAHSVCAFRNSKEPSWFFWNQNQLFQVRRKWNVRRWQMDIKSDQISHPVLQWKQLMYGLWYAARVLFPHPRLIAHVKERKMQSVLLMKTPGCVLVDLAVGGSNPGQCQSVCVHSLCCGSFQITETWCGSLFPSDSQLLPFLLHGKTGGGISREGGGGGGVMAQSQLYSCSYLQLQTTKLPTLGCCALSSVLWVSMCVLWALCLIQKMTAATKMDISYLLHYCMGTKSFEFTFKLK